MIGSKNCASDILLSLQALQHRGQDASGVATIHHNEFPLIKRVGLASQGFGPNEVAQLPGSIGIGHVRYPTIGRGVLRDAQPFFYRQPGVLMAHNGNFTNVGEMHESLMDESVHLMSRCDVEPVLCLFALELMNKRRKEHTIEDAMVAIRNTFKKVRGAFSIVAALLLEGKETLMAVRDPRGIRPAVWGTHKNGYIAASESVALDVLDAKLEEDVAPGEVMFFQEDREPVRFQLKTEQPAPCIFEYIYFARPDSTMNRKSVYGVRLDLGRQLAHAWRAKGRQADVVIPIPDTSRPAATALAEELGLPHREGFIKNRYTGRTFIMPDADERATAMKLKLNPIHSEFAGKRVLVTDDSIVRGTTLNHTIQLIRDQGPTEIHLAIHSPPVLFPCYYGIDMSTREELAATSFVSLEHLDAKSSEQIARLEDGFANRLGLDSLTYLPLSGLAAAYGQHHCAACFDGEYPLAVNSTQRCWIEDDRRSCCAQRKLLL